MADCTAPVPRPAALSPRVQILDFGLVRVASEQVQITQSGAILGTPAFMAPEQAAGETVDARADLFSLGATLYRMVTGEQAFKGANTLAILSGLANVTPPEPRSMDSRVPPRLNDLIMRLLAKKPEERPQNAREIIDTLALLRLERDSDTTTSIVTPTPVATAGTNAARRRWALWAATAGGIIAFVVLAIAFFSGGTGNRQGEPQPDKGTGSVNEPDRGLDALKPGQDRKVAELVLKRGGMVRIDRGRGLSGDQPLPEEPFQLTSVLSTGISDDDLAQFAGLTSLEYLELGGLSEVSNAGLGNLRDLPKLRVLIMTGSRVYDSGLKHLTSLPALEELSLGNREGAREKARITGAGLAPLRQLPDLRKLTLARVPLGEEGSGHIAALARLETLSLLECDIGVPEARKIARLRQLRVLGIIKTLLSGDAMASLAPLTSLTELNLQATQLGDSDLVHLKGMTKLQSLILTDNAGVTDAGLKHVEFLKALRSARLRGTKVTADGVAALHEAVPDCDIESEWNN